MALGDKLPVVMGKEKAAANGVATLGADGKLAEEQRPTPTEAGAADLTLSNLSNRQKALRNIGGRPNRNFLDNWYFVGGGSQQGGGQFPINQRGQTSYTGTRYGYGIDRWMCSNPNTPIEINSNGVKINNSLQENDVYLEQKIENIGILHGKITLSVLSSASNAYATARIVVFYNDTVEDTAGVATELSTITVDLDNYENITGFEFRIGNLVPYRSGTNLIAAKLELGDHQTLAYQDEDGAWQLFETPDYGEELEKCQRYYLPIDGIGRFPAVFSPLSTILQVFIPTPVTMRSVPTVLGITSLSARVYTGAANSQTLSVSEVLKTETGVQIIFSCSWPGSTSPAVYSNAVVVFGQRGALSAEL